MALYYSFLGLMVFFAICMVTSAYYMDTKHSKKAFVFLCISIVFIIISIGGLLVSYDHMLETETLEAKDITIKVHYIDGTTQNFSFENIRKWYPEIRHYKGDYHIRVEDRIIIGAYRYEVLKQTNKTITFNEYYNSRK